MTPFIELPTVYMPFFCLAFLLASLFSLYCVIAAAVCRVPKRYTCLCGMLLLVCLPPTAVLTEGCYALYTGKLPLPMNARLMRVPAILFAVIAAILLVAGVRTCFRLNKWRNGHISRMSIKESVDLLPMGLCFCYADNMPRLVNLRMNALSRALTGSALTDPNGFWKTLESEVLKPGCARIRAGECPIIKISDGTVWTFEQKWLQLDGVPIRQLTATDTTEEYQLVEQLANENRRLREMSERLRVYGDTVREVTREKEILNAKMRIHDELGQALIASRRLLSVQAPRGEREAVAALWKSSVSFLNKEYTPEKATDAYAQLTNAARAIGVSIRWHGEMPREDTSAARILQYMAHECLTNAVRHASGTEVCVSARRGQGRWVFVCTNNGDVPQAPVIEGGGLSGLRCRVERAGGEMRIAHTHRFELTIAIPEECEAGLWSNTES